MDHVFALLRWIRGLVILVYGMKAKYRNVPWSTYLLRLWRSADAMLRRARWSKAPKRLSRQTDCNTEERAMSQHDCGSWTASDMTGLFPIYDIGHRPLAETADLKAEIELILVKGEDIP